jgi:hypothetical protein
MPVPNLLGRSRPPVQEAEGNEEIRYPDPDSNKTKVNYAKEPNEAHKNTLKKKSCKKSMRIL